MHSHLGNFQRWINCIFCVEIKDGYGFGKSLYGVITPM